MVGDRGGDKVGERLSVNQRKILENIEKESLISARELSGLVRISSRNIKYPICIDGERACPPEDCGGKDWNPEKFDKNSIRFDNHYNRWKKAFLGK